MMWKILTAQVRKEIYNLLSICRLFSKEKKGRCKGSRGTSELLQLYQHMINENKIRRENLAMALIDYANAYDMFLQSWMINCFKIYKISH